MNIFEGFYSTMNAELSPTGKITVCPEADACSFYRTLNNLCGNEKDQFERWKIAPVVKTSTMTVKEFPPHVIDTVTEDCCSTNSGYFEFGTIPCKNFIYHTEMEGPGK